MAITDTVTAQWVKDRFLVGVDLTIAMTLAAAGMFCLFLWAVKAP